MFTVVPAAGSRNALNGPGGNRRDGRRPRRSARPPRECPSRALGGDSRASRRRTHPKVRVTGPALPGLARRQGGDPLEIGKQPAIDHSVVAAAARILTSYSCGASVGVAPLQYSARSKTECRRFASRQGETRDAALDCRRCMYACLRARCAVGKRGRGRLRAQEVHRPRKYGRSEGDLDLQGQR